MMIPASPTLPQQTVLSPMQTMGKLAGLRGFGCGCSQSDDTGACIDPDPCSTAPIGTSTPSGGDLDFGNLFGPILQETPSQVDAQIYQAGVYTDASGNVVIPGQGSVSPTGTVTKYNAPAAPSGAAPPTGLTATQQASLASALISGGFSLAKEAAAQPGMVIGPNGQISYQNPGYPVSGVAGSLTTPSSSSLIMIAVVAIGGLALFSSIGRGR